MVASKKRKEQRSHFDVGQVFKKLKKSANVGSLGSDDGESDDEQGVSRKRGPTDEFDGESEDYGESDEEDMSSTDDDDDDDDDDGDDEGENDEEGDDGDDAEDVDNSMALAEAMSKVLRKKVTKEVPILAKSGGSQKVIDDARRIEEDHKKKVRQTKALQQVGRVKPKLLGTETDRKLARLATRGAVRLFNAVNDQQKAAHDAVASAPTKLLTTKKERDIKAMSKDKFLSVLASQTKDSSLPEHEGTGGQAVAAAVPSFMRDDYMMKAKAKDWDRAAREHEADEDEDRTRHGSEDEPDADDAE